MHLNHPERSEECLLGKLGQYCWSKGDTNIYFPAVEDAVLEPRLLGIPRVGCALWELTLH